jgi:hypothetical protein
MKRQFGDGTLEASEPNRHREAAFAAMAIQENPQTLPWIASGFAALAGATTQNYGAIF